MNAANGKDSTTILSLSYNYADPNSGFLFSGPDVSAEEYVKNMYKSYEYYRTGTQAVIDNWDTIIGTNIANNNFRKERTNFQQIEEYFEDTYVNILDADRQEMTIDTLIKHFQSKQAFVIILNMYRLGAPEHCDMCSDMMMWATECRKLNSDPTLSSLDRLRLGRTKNMKLKFTDAKSMARLDGCHLVDVLNNRTFSFVVERITFVV